MSNASEMAKTDPSIPSVGNPEMDQKKQVSQKPPTAKKIRKRNLEDVPSKRPPQLGMAKAPKFK